MTEETRDNVETFTKRMRRATRDVHALSDALVNAKLGVALSNNKVWAEGLLVFYEVFHYLEDAMDRLRGTDISVLDIPEMKRTEAFEADLAHFLGADWKQTYTIRPTVGEYLKHLHDLEAEQPILLMAYIYHLYMGLLSGGQIFQRKRAIANSLNLSSLNSSMDGMAVVTFSVPISNLKRQMREAMDTAADSFDEETKELLIQESKVVFQLNNIIVRDIRGVNDIFYSKLAAFLLFFIILTLIVKLYSFV